MRSLYVFVVDRGEHLQIERTTARCGLTEDEVRSIAQARFAGDRRVAHADHVLRNDDDIRSLRRQLQTTHAQYLESARSTPDAPRTKPLFLLTFGEYLPQFNRPGLCVISYEYPLSERIRTLLRLEDLCERLDYFLGKNEALEHHVSLLLIFEIYEVASRADLKSDLLQELERQKQSLEALRGNPEISEQALENVIQQIDQSASRLYQASGKIGQELRENDWLMSIKQRTNIPGGICEFDLPSYHYWLHLKPEQQRQDLEQWLAPFLPVRDAVDIVLRLLRASGKSSVQVAQQGMYQQMMTGRVAQMVRVRLARGYQCVPEISANKYALNIRFMTQEGMQRPRAAETDVEFELTFCNL